MSESDAYFQNNISNIELAFMLLSGEAVLDSTNRSAFGAITSGLPGAHYTANIRIFEKEMVTDPLAYLQKNHEKMEFLGLKILKRSDDLAKQIVDMSDLLASSDSNNRKSDT